MLSFVVYLGSQLRGVPRLLLGYSRLAVSWWGAEAALEGAGAAAGALQAAPALRAARAALTRGPVLLQAAGVRQPAPLRHLMFPPEADTCSGNTSDHTNTTCPQFILGTARLTLLARYRIYVTSL